MKILLVYPKLRMSCSSVTSHVKLFGTKNLASPMGLLIVASLLPCNWEKRLIDMRNDLLRDEDLEWADQVFISANILQHVSAIEVVRRAKEKGVRIVAGGPLFTLVPDAVEGIDHILTGEAEVTLPLYLEDLSKGEAKKIYKAKGFADLDKVPFSSWELIDKNKYLILGLEYSRGCIHNCNFCTDSALYGPVPRTKSKERVLEALDNLYDTGWRGTVGFTDNNFLANVNTLKREILPAMIEWTRQKDFPFTFMAQVTAEVYRDDQLLKLLSKAGFSMLIVGFESTSNKSLTECGKTHNLKVDVRECIKKIQSYNMYVVGTFIVGFDEDTPDIFEDIISAIQESGLIFTGIFCLVAYPGTRLYKKMENEGRLRLSAIGDVIDAPTNFVPKMGYEVLISGWEKVISEVHSQKGFCERMDRLMEVAKGKRNEKRSGFKLNLRILKVFCKIIFFYGVIGKSRLWFWKIFAASLARGRKLFPFVMLGFIDCVDLEHYYKDIKFPELSALKKELL